VSRVIWMALIWMALTEYDCIDIRYTCSHDWASWKEKRCKIFFVKKTDNRCL